MITKGYLLAIAAAEDERKKTSHAAELEAKDKRIAELEAELVGWREWADSKDCVPEDVVSDGPMRAIIDNELAKRKELPPLPDLVEGWMESTRRKINYRESITCGERAVYNLLRELYPAPVPQWERDAQYIESVVRKFGCNAPERLSEIAARIREAGRGSK